MSQNVQPVFSEDQSFPPSRWRASTKEAGVYSDTPFRASLAHQHPSSLPSAAISLRTTWVGTLVSDSRTAESPASRSLTIVPDQNS
jgi:hypothetical protein